MWLQVSSKSEECLSREAVSIVLFEPSAEKMFLWPVFQNFRISNSYLECEEDLSIFAFSKT